MKRFASRLILLGFALAVLIVVCTLQREARAAQAGSREGLVVGVKSGVSYLSLAFTGECCGEDDAWTGIGPRVTGLFGWGISERFRLSSDWGYAFLVAPDTSSHTDLTMQVLEIQAAAEWINQGGFRVGLGAGGGAVLTRGAGFEGTMVASPILMFRAGYEHFLSSSFSMGFDVSWGIAQLRPAPIGRGGIAVPANVSVVAAWM